MPSYSALAAVAGFCSKNAAYKLGTRLMDQGWLEKDVIGTLLPGPLFHTVPVLGAVTVGFPSPAKEALADTMSLDEFLITNREATYILKVNGESMIGQGHSVFQFHTNKGQCQFRLSREAAARGRNVGGACPLQQPNRGIA